jgi:hypothetical protein
MTRPPGLDVSVGAAIPTGDLGDSADGCGWAAFDEQAAASKATGRTTPLRRSLVWPIIVSLSSAISIRLDSVESSTATHGRDDAAMALSTEFTDLPGAASDIAGADPHAQV